MFDPLRSPRAALAVRALAVGLVAVLAGQARAAWPVEFNCFPINAAQETPPNGSLGTGVGYCTINTMTNEFTWFVSYSGLSGPATAAHFHVGAPGVPGGIEIPVGTANPAKGSTFVTPGQTGIIQTGGWYFNVHTAMFPGGELRGQVVQTGCVQWTDLHEGKSGTNRIVALLGHGPMTGGSLNEVQLIGALPNTSGTLVVGFTQLMLPFKDSLIIPSPDFLISLPVDATGKNTLPFVWPTSPALVGFSLYWQEWYVDSGATFNLAASKGLQSTGQ